MLPEKINGNICLNDIVDSIFSENQQCRGMNPLINSLLCLFS